MRADGPRVARRAERRQGVGRLRPAGGRAVRAGAPRTRGRRPRVVPARRRRAARRRARGRARERRLLLDHRLRRGGRHEQTRGPRPQLPRLGGRARRHRAGAATRAGRRSRRRARSARSRRSSLRCSSASARAREHDRRLDDARRAPARVAVAGAHAGIRLLLDLRDARRRACSPSPRSSRSSSRASASSSAGPSSPSGSTTTTRPRSATSSGACSRRARCADWLGLFEGEDVCVGPVATLAEAAREFGRADAGRAPRSASTREQWREELRA